MRDPIGPSDLSLQIQLPQCWPNGGNTLVYRSFIQTLGHGPIEQEFGDAASQFIRENCTSARRLRALAVMAYEALATFPFPQVYQPIGTYTFLALTAAISMIDANACVLWGVLRIPKGKRFPDMHSLKEWLQSEGHFLFHHVRTLLECDWAVKLRAARNAVVHHGAWPKFGPNLEFLMGRKVEGPPHFCPEKTWNQEEFPMVDIMNGVLGGFEEWDLALQPIFESNGLAPKYGTVAEVNAFVAGKLLCDNYALGEAISYYPTNAMVKEMQAYYQKTKASGVAGQDADDQDGQSPGLL
jgi:hypothetical protein